MMKKKKMKILGNIKDTNEKQLQTIKHEHLELIKRITGNKLKLKSLTAQKIKFSIKDFFSKCDQIWFEHFTEEILNPKLHFFVQCLRLRG